MNRLQRLLTATGVIASLGVALALPPVHAAGGLSGLDKSYLKDTSQSNIEEIQFGPTVRRKASHPQVRQYGRRMVRDHSRAQRQLLALAHRKHISLPRGPSEDEKEIMARLAREPQGRFDAAYKQEMIRDHTTDIAETRREISLGHDRQVRADAQKNLRLLQKHLQMARMLPGGR